MTWVRQRGHDEEKPPTFVGSSEADCEITLCGYMELRVPRDVLQERGTVVRGLESDGDYLYRIRIGGFASIYFAVYRLFFVCSAPAVASGITYPNIMRSFFSSSVGCLCNNNGVFRRILSETSRMSLQVALEPQVVRQCATSASFELPYLTPVECSFFFAFF